MLRRSSFRRTPRPSSESTCGLDGVAGKPASAAQRRIDDVACREQIASPGGYAKSLQRVGARAGAARLSGPSTDWSLFRRGFLLEDSKAVVLTTTPQTNVTVASTSIQTRDLDTGTTLAVFDQPGFATAHQLGDDLLVAVLARGPTEASMIVAYRITRE